MNPSDRNPSQNAAVIPLRRPGSGQAGQISDPPPRLLDRVRAALRARHYSERTLRAYVGWIRRFILFHTWCRGGVARLENLGPGRRQPGTDRAGSGPGCEKRLSVRVGCARRLPVRVGSLNGSSFSALPNRPMKSIRPQGHWCSIGGAPWRPARCLSARRSTDPDPAQAVLTSIYADIYSDHG